MFEANHFLKILSLGRAGINRINRRQMFNSYLWVKQIDLIMSENWTLSRRRFLGIAVTTAAGLMLSPNLYAKSGEKPMIRFGMISDVHYANRESAGTRFYKQSLGKVQEAIERMNQEKLDFAIELGDFKDQDAVPNEANTLKYLADIESVFQKFKGPTYHVLGNHDTDGISKQQFLERVENTGIPKTESYYSFGRKGIHFLVLDGDFTKEGKAYDHGNFSWDDASVPEEEIDWLKADLKLNKLPVIVFIHQMLDDSKDVKQAVQNAAEVRQILEQSGNVLCVFQGHVHEERYNLINGIHYYSVNAVVDGDGPENSAYMIVDIYKDGSLKIDGFRRATDREIVK
jgi:predicted phosphodiesterase